MPRPGAGGSRGWSGEVAKRPNASDCKSDAPRASKVRILPSPPVGQVNSAERGFREAARGLEGERRERPGSMMSRAGVAQLVELQPSKLDVAGSNPVARSNRRCGKSVA